MRGGGGFGHGGGGVGGRGGFGGGFGGPGGGFGRGFGPGGPGFFGGPLFGPWWGVGPAAAVVIGAAAVGYAAASSDSRRVYVYDERYNNSRSSSSCQDRSNWVDYELTIPEYAVNGESFRVSLGGVEYDVTCPMDAYTGEVIIVSAPRTNTYSKRTTPQRVEARPSSSNRPAPPRRYDSISVAQATSTSAQPALAVAVAVPLVSITQEEESAFAHTASLRNPTSPSSSSSSQALTKKANTSSSSRHSDKISSQSHHNSNNLPPLTDFQKNLYTQMYFQHGGSLEHGIPSEQAFIIFQQLMFDNTKEQYNQVPHHVLAKLWVIADQDNDGMLNLNEWIVALQLLNIVKSGGVIP